MPTIKNPAGKILVLFLAAVTLFAGCMPPGPRALLRGKKLLEQAKYEQAVEQLKSATILCGTNSQAFNYLGLACHQSGQWSEAAKAYQRAVALNPDLSEARYNLGCLWLDQAKYEQAKIELTAYTLRRQNVAEGWLKLGTAQLRLSESGSSSQRVNELAAAERDYREGLRLSPRDPEALTGLGLVRLRHGQPMEAAQFFKRASQEQPGNRPALLNLAIVAQQYLGDPKLALLNYHAYLALDPAPEDSEQVRQLVSQLEQSNAVRPTSPNQPIEAVSKSGPPEPLRSLTPTLAVSTATSRALGHDRAEHSPNVAGPSVSGGSAGTSPLSSPATPSNPEVVALPVEPTVRLARDVGPANGPGSAEDGVKTPELHNGLSSNQQSVARTPRYPYASLARLKPGNRSQAERVFAQGVQAQQGQRLSEAIRAYQRTVQLDPSFFDAYYNLALALTQVGNLPRALATYESALSARPESTDARYNFALVLQQAGYWFDASNELEMVVVTRPNDCRSHLALANLYSQHLNQPAKARQHYLKVLDIDPGNPQGPGIRSWLAEASH